MPRSARCRAAGRCRRASSTVTGFGTSPSSVRYSIDASQSAGSIAPSPRSLLDRPAPDLDRRVEDGRLRLARRGELRDGRRWPPRARPRGRPRSPPSPAASRRRTPRSRRASASSVAVAGDQPVARQRRDLVDAQDGDLLAGQLELDRLVVGEPGRRVDRALRDRGALAEVGVLDDLEVVGRQAGRAEQRLEHDPRRAVAARDAELLAREVGRRRRCRTRPWRTRSTGTGRRSSRRTGSGCPG